MPREDVDRIENLEVSIRRALKKPGSRVVCMKTDREANLAVPPELLMGFVEG